MSFNLIRQVPGEDVRMQDTEHRMPIRTITVPYCIWVPDYASGQLVELNLAEPSSGGPTRRREIGNPDDGGLGYIHDLALAWRGKILHLYVTRQDDQQQLEGMILKSDGSFIGTFPATHETDFAVSRPAVINGELYALGYARDSHFPLILKYDPSQRKFNEIQHLDDCGLRENEVIQGFEALGDTFVTYLSSGDSDVLLFHAANGHYKGSTPAENGGILQPGVESPYLLYPQKLWRAPQPNDPAVSSDGNGTIINLEEASNPRGFAIHTAPNPAQSRLVIANALPGGKLEFLIYQGPID